MDSQTVVYTLDEDLKPSRFLAVVGSFEERQAEMDRWWKAFESGEKAKPPEYNGISSRPVADFDRWKEGDADTEQDPQREAIANWWHCPECGEETEIVNQRTRRCTVCDWSVTIPTPQEYIDDSADWCEDHGGEGVPGIEGDRE